MGWTCPTTAARRRLDAVDSSHAERRRRIRLDHVLVSRAKRLERFGQLSVRRNDTGRKDSSISVNATTVDCASRSPTTRRRRSRLRRNGQHRNRRRHVETHRGDVAGARRSERNVDQHLSRRRAGRDDHRNDERTVERVARFALRRRQPQRGVERIDRVAHVRGRRDRRVPHLLPRVDRGRRRSP